MVSTLSPAEQAALESAQVIVRHLDQQEAAEFWFEYLVEVFGFCRAHIGEPASAIILAGIKSREFH